MHNHKNALNKRKPKMMVVYLLTYLYNFTRTYTFYTINSMKEHKATHHPIQR
jgi:hypothetical protein